MYLLRLLLMPHPSPTQAPPIFQVLALTSLAGLRREKRRRGQRRCRCPEHQLRMLSHSTVRVGPGPSSRCSKTNCFKARTAVFSSICSSCGRQRQLEVMDSFSTLTWLNSVPSQNNTVRVYMDLYRHRRERDGILREGLGGGAYYYT